MRDFSNMRADKPEPIDVDLYLNYWPIKKKKEEKEGKDTEEECVYDRLGDVSRSREIHFDNTCSKNNKDYTCMDHECISNEPRYVTMFELDKIPNVVSTCKNGYEVPYV